MKILDRAWQRWKVIGQFMGDWIARVILTIFYTTLFLPFGLGTRYFSDPLALRQSDLPRWMERRTRDITISDARRLS